MATFTKRGKGQWQVKIRRKGWPLQTKTFETKGDAEAWAREIESEMDRGVFVSRKEAECSTFREVIERFREEYIPRYAHPKKEESRLNHLLNYPLAEQFMASIRTKHLIEYIKTREAEGVGAHTIRLDLALISKIFEVARKDWGMDSLSNPVKRMTKPKIPQGRDRRLKRQVEVDGKIMSEETLLLQHASKRLKPIIKFALETAMRREEIVTLTWDRVNFETRTAYLPHTKNGEARTVPLSPKAIKILKELIPDKTIPIHGRVFQLSKGRLSKNFRAACLKANIKNLRFHDLRHEATSRLFENTDLDVMEIKGITGHKTLQMLARYAHLRADRLAKRLEGEKRGVQQTNPAER
ncbi:site-specific integrase [Desulfoplanes formicivorans]|uniref:Integrase n=1 Tax=Desulfoplanes formicivorans TaxID=1592317 RepID=A0A194AFN6_9BACT|nr:site-specific integrase [Desulfoplanes formicivorans]GAU08892.1 integrase [Desulfoplanes formicivorans]